MQISFVMLIFLYCFRIKFRGGQKSLRGQTTSGGAPFPCGRKPDYFYIVGVERPNGPSVNAYVYLSIPCSQVN